MQPSSTGEWHREARTVDQINDTKASTDVRSAADVVARVARGITFRPDAPTLPQGSGFEDFLTASTPLNQACGIDACETDCVKRAELLDVAAGLRAIADVIEADFVDDEEPDTPKLAALVLRAQASALDALNET